MTKMMLAAAMLLVGFVAGAQAQMQHDPLNSHEVDEMRKSAQNPKQRIDYLIEFARVRVLAIERLRTAAQPSLGDDDKVAQLLSDLADVIDELDDNLDMYNSHSEDLRHPLRQVLKAESEFQQKLKTLGDTATPELKRSIDVALEDASDSLESSTESARAMLTDQLDKKGSDQLGKKGAEGTDGMLDRQPSQPKPMPDAGDQLPPGQPGMGGSRGLPVER